MTPMILIRRHAADFLALVFGGLMILVACQRPISLFRTAPLTEIAAPAPEAPQVPQIETPKAESGEDSLRRADAELRALREAVLADRRRKEAHP